MLKKIVSIWRIFHRKFKMKLKLIFPYRIFGIFCQARNSYGFRWQSQWPCQEVGHDFWYFDYQCSKCGWCKTSVQESIGSFATWGRTFAKKSEEGTFVVIQAEIEADGTSTFGKSSWTVYFLNFFESIFFCKKK